MESGDSAGVAEQQGLLNQSLTSRGVTSPMATSATPTQVAAPTFSLDLPPEIPSTSLRGNATYNDVLAARNRAEQDQMNSQALGGQYDQLMGRIQTPVSSTPFRNPEAFINNLLLNRPTDTQTQLDAARGDQAGAIRGFAGDYSQAGDKAREQLGVGNLQAELGNTRNRIAERTTKFRQDLRNFAVNAEQRGVAREFVDGAKQKLQADAAAELADLSIIEAAQTGNLQMAQQEVDRVLQEKLQGFEFENQAIEAEIRRLEAVDTREADTRKTQLEIALQERSRNIETNLADEREKRSYMIDAAQNGADQGTLDAIRQATSAGEAALLAGPWTGRIQRRQAEANISQSNASAAASYASAANARTSRLISLAEVGNPEAIAALGITMPDNTVPTTDEIAYAQQYAATGTIPSGMPKNISFGRISELAKDLPKPAGSVVDINTGVKPNIPAAQLDGIAALKDLITKSEQLALLNEQRSKGITAGVAYLAGSDLQQQYVDLRGEIVDLLARARTGAALTVDEQRYYEDQLPGTTTGAVKQLAFGPLAENLGQDTTARIRENFTGKLKGSLDTKLSSQGLAVYGYSTVDTSQGPLTIGDVITNAAGQRGIVQADGSITPIQ